MQINAVHSPCFCLLVAQGAGSDPSVKREEGDEPLLDHESSDEDDFEQ